MAQKFAHLMVRVICDRFSEYPPIYAVQWPNQWAPLKLGHHSLEPLTAVSTVWIFQDRKNILRLSAKFVSAECCAHEVAQFTCFGIKPPLSAKAKSNSCNFLSAIVSSLHRLCCAWPCACLCVCVHAVANIHSWRRQEDRSVRPLGNYGVAAGILRWWSSWTEREMQRDRNT